MRLLLLIVTVLLFFTGFSQGQQPVSFSFTAQPYRQQHKQHLTDNIIKRTLQLPATQAHFERWSSAYWAMELLLYRSPQAQKKIGEAWKNVSTLSEGFQKALLEVSYTLYPTEFEMQASRLLQNTTSVPVFVRCAEYLGRTKPLMKTNILRLAAQKFPQPQLGIALLQKRLQKTTAVRPPLAELFRPDFLPGETVIFSLHRSHRNVPGLVLIRKPDGSFVTDKDGRIFHTTQLARAITGYPYYITNGNTPQGLFRWNGFDTSGISYIGPTANLQLVMPNEEGEFPFFENSDRDTALKRQRYTQLLPPSWRTSDALYESFNAGAMGRTEIIMHGTTIDPSYYKGQSYFPQTPSLGCLCSYEEWNAKGQRTVSHQQQIVDALRSIGVSKGYVVVVDLDDKKTPVSLSDVSSFLIKNLKNPSAFLRMGF